MNDQVRRFELDMSEPDPPPEGRRDRRHTLRLGPGGRRWLALIAALAVGAALGGLGVRKERDAAAAREARRTISLVAAVSGTLSDPTGPEGTFPVAIRIYNGGPKAVRILDTTLSAPRFRSAVTEGTVSTEVGPGTWGLLTPILGAPDCSRLAGRPAKLTATVATADRRRKVDVPLVDAGGNLAEVWDNACTGTSETGPPDILQALYLAVQPPLSFTKHSDRSALQATLDASVERDYPRDQVVTITGAAESGLLRTRLVGSHPMRVTSLSTMSGTIELSIASCRRPLTDYGEEEFNVPIRVRSDAGETTMYAWTPAPVVVQIAELYHRTCG